MASLATAPILPSARLRVACPWGESGLRVHSRAMSLHAAARSIDFTPSVGVPVPDPLDRGAAAVLGPLRGALLLLEDGAARVAWLSLNLCYVTVELQEAVADAVRTAAGVAPDALVIACTRNLSSPVPFPDVARGLQHDRLLDGIAAAAAASAADLAPARVAFAEGSWPRLQYNRKGVAADGTTFFRREPDRVARPEPVGLIDPRVAVLRVDRCADERPMAAVVQYTGDPCIATSMTDPVISSDVNGYACMALADAIAPEFPVLYLQGAKGDVALKHMFAGDEVARTEGRLLGSCLKDLVDAARPLADRPLPGRTLTTDSVTVRLPLQELPGLEELASARAELDRFFAAVRSGDLQATRIGLGYNLPDDASLEFREAYLRRIEDWVEWAERARETGAPVRTHVDLRLSGHGVGGFAFVTTWAEVFGSIGLAVRERAASTRLMFACCCGAAWPDDPGTAKWAYIPGARDLDGNEYMSAFYRHTRFLTQYRAPAGDLLIAPAVELCDRMVRGGSDA